MVSVEWLTSVALSELVLLVLVVVAFSVVWEGVCRWVARVAEERAQRNAASIPHAKHPFMNKRPVYYHALRFVWPGPLLIPVRFFGLIMVCVVVSICGWVTCATAPRDAKEKPLSGWRKAFMVPVAQLLSRLLLLFAGFTRIKVVGRCATSEEAPIIVANHRGPFEPFFLFAQHYCCMVSRVENRIWPLHFPMDALQFICVDRYGTSREKKTVMETIRSRAMSSEQWPQTVLFPEGVSGNGTELLRFKPGAFLPGVAVQPVLFEYPSDIDDVDPSWTHGLSGPLDGLLSVLLRTTSCWSVTMHVRYLPVHVPTADERGNPSLFSDTVRCKMAEALGVPLSDMQMEDVLPATAAVVNHIDPATAVNDCARIVSTFCVKPRDARALLATFRGRQWTPGSVKLERIAEVFNLPLTSVAEAFKDTAGDTPTCITFPRFLAVMGSLSRGCSRPAGNRAWGVHHAFATLGEGDAVEGLARAVRSACPSAPSRGVPLLLSTIGGSGVLDEQRLARFFTLGGPSCAVRLLDLLEEEATEVTSLANPPHIALRRSAIKALLADLCSTSVELP